VIAGGLLAAPLAAEGKEVRKPPRIGYLSFVVAVTLVVSLTLVLCWTLGLVVLLRSRVLLIVLLYYRLTGLVLVILAV
jgi:hypothetical protein